MRHFWKTSLTLALLTTQAPATDPAPLMPKPEDYTLMWWAEGFPEHTPAAPWRRVIQTGRYAMALDTDRLTIPHFGPLHSPGYTAAALSRDDAWRKLPPAELALTIDVDGKTYRCVRGGPQTAFTGPRIVESGRFVQRTDVTDLEFRAEDGAQLNVEARFEVVAWPDRLAMILAARPGVKAIPAGDRCFGRIGGGFGLDGSNHFEIAHSPEIDPAAFTLEFWTFVPTDFQASEKTHPWLVCKNHHEQADGNYGIVLLDGKPQARMNIGGGRDNLFVANSDTRLRIDQWNHLAMSYDGDTLRLFLNGEQVGATKIGRPRKAGSTGLAFGRRQDNCGDGFHFRGVIDEVRFHDHALTLAEVRERLIKPDATNTTIRPVRSWNFREEVQASPTKPGDVWTNAAMEIRLGALGNVFQQRVALSAGESWKHDAWKEVSVVLDENTGIPSGRSSGWLTGLFHRDKPAEPFVPEVREIPQGRTRPVTFDAARGWHAINLDEIEPSVPGETADRQNDAMERVKVGLYNPSDREQVARLLFEKTAHGIRQRIGSAITGVSAVLRDSGRNPTGIPVQLSKNWHNRPEGGVYAGQWFHGFTQIHVPPRTNVVLELAIAYGHWGGVAAASHAQLCLIGWGSNQQWDQSALGSWGESICYEPDQAQAKCGILDVRPVMVRSVNDNKPWGWTHNVGGGDFVRLFDAGGQRVFPARMKTAYEKQGPCLTEVTYAGNTGDGLEHAVTVSLGRTDDLVRGLYRLRLDVTRPVDFSRLVLFQIGAETYNYSADAKMALGNESGLISEWITQTGGNTNGQLPMICKGSIPWISLHEGGDAREPRRHEATPGLVRAGQPAVGAWANRGIVLRSWKARLGGKEASPWLIEHTAKETRSTTADLIPPPQLTQLLPGDFVEATIEHVIVPQSADDYYGPNEGLRAALRADGNTWRMIEREAKGNARLVEMHHGVLTRTFPDIRIRGKDDAAEFTLKGGLGYVPVTVDGLSSPQGFMLRCDGKVIDQQVHGGDGWQIDFDPAARRWSYTTTIPVRDNLPHRIRFERTP